MRDHSKHIELSREEAVAAMLGKCAFPKAEGAPMEELVPVAESFGRVLARDVASLVDKPNKLQCCMDSIAVHWEAFEGLPAGELPDTSAWVRGADWEFANTGVAMPDGFDAAIVIEHVSVSADEQHVQIDAAPSARFAGTRAPGSQMKRGDVLARAGETVTPDVAARIATGNVTAVPVRVKPKVAFIPTGDELVVPGGPIETGRNIETNSLLFRGKVEKWGGVPLVFDIVPDDPGLIKDAIRRACAMADIVVLNAGSSKGSEDWNCEQMEELGEVICHETNHGPGHHSSYALVDGTPVVGISGPPAGASFTLNFYLRPLMMRFLGRPTEPERIPVRLAAPFPAKKGHGGGKAIGAAKAGGAGDVAAGADAGVSAAGDAAIGADAAGAETAAGAAASGESAPAKVAGEVRPSIVAPGATFFSIKFLTVEAAPDGALSGTPLPGRPGSPEAEAANAYYMMPSGPGVKPPAVGDVIWVEMR